MILRGGIVDRVLFALVLHTAIRFQIWRQTWKVKLVCIIWSGLLFTTKMIGFAFVQRRMRMLETIHEVYQNSVNASEVSKMIFDNGDTLLTPDNWILQGLSFKKSRTTYLHILVLESKPDQFSLIYLVLWFDSFRYVYIHVLYRPKLKWL